MILHFTTINLKTNCTPQNIFIMVDTLKKKYAINSGGEYFVRESLYRTTGCRTQQVDFALWIRIVV